VIETKESEIEEEKSVTPDKGKDEHPTPTKGKSGKSSKDDKKGDKERKKSAERKTTSKGSRRNSMAPPSPTPGQTTPISDGDALRYGGQTWWWGSTWSSGLGRRQWLCPTLKLLHYHVLLKFMY